MANITQYLEIILNGKDLTFDQAKALQDTIFEGQVTEVQIAAFLAMMRMKRATSERDRRAGAVAAGPCGAGRTSISRT